MEAKKPRNAKAVKSSWGYVILSGRAYEEGDLASHWYKSDVLPCTQFRCPLVAS
jgi:hypothetical protein